MQRISYKKLIEIRNFRGFRYSSCTSKITLKIIILLMSINLFISILILNQQSKYSVFFNAYYDRFIEKNLNKDLFFTLQFYRSKFQNDRTNDNFSEELTKKFKFLRNVFNETYDVVNITKTSANRQISNNDNGNWNNEKDYLFNRESFVNDFLNPNHDNHKKYYEPNILINNRNACKNRNKEHIFLVCLIHSHKNNFLRRKTMRDTWLSMDQLSILEVFKEKFKKKDKGSFDSAELLKDSLDIVHFFIIGNDNNQNNQTSFEQIKKESELYNDILMIDAPENYQNLVYKHLAAVNWVVRNCPQAVYVMKLDDDVFVNIKPLAEHLITRFGLMPSLNSNFIYCSLVDKAIPARKNDSKWYVSYDTYPFDYYPRYCEGFSYITNIETIKIMYKQSRIIPRFWIDDVYVTGLLLFGFDQIEWYNYNQLIKWSFYDYWDIGNSHFLYEIYARFLKVFDIHSSDYYKTHFFVVIHVQMDNKEMSYEVSVKKNTDQTLQKSNFCSDLINSKYLEAKNSQLYLNQVTNCFGEDKSKYNIHFYNFCARLWNRS